MPVYCPGTSRYECNAPMVEVVDRGVRLDFCEQCGNVLFNDGEVATFTERIVEEATGQQRHVRRPEQGRRFDPRAMFAGGGHGGGHGMFLGSSSDRRSHGGHTAYGHGGHSAYGHRTSDTPLENAMEALGFDSDNGGYYGSD